MNSPGSAYRTTVEDVLVRDMALRTAFTMAGPPWICSSRTSSPVTVLGAGKWRIRAPASRMVFGLGGWSGS